MAAPIEPARVIDLGPGLTGGTNLMVDKVA